MDYLYVLFCAWQIDRDLVWNLNQRINLWVHSLFMFMLEEENNNGK